MRWLNNAILRLLLKLNGGEKDMVALYALLIMKGLRTFESVPANLKPDVSAHLRAMELDEDGKPLNPLAE